MIYDSVGATTHPLNLAPEFRQKQIFFNLKLISSMIKYTIQEIIDWAPSFSLLEIALQKECFLCFIWVLKLLEVDTDPERRFVSFNVTTPNGSSLFLSLRGIAPEQLARARFSEGLQNYMQIKMKDLKTK